MVPPAGPGTFTVASGETAPTGTGGPIVTYRVEVEDGLPYAPLEFASAVDATLSSGQGWATKGYSFARQAAAPLRIVLASPATTDTLCAPLRTRGEVSCRNGDVVAINAKRWTEGAEAYGGDLDSYRIYVINHEVGHALGRPHEQCPHPGALAPVMLQQTLGLEGCRANPWP